MMLDSDINGELYKCGSYCFGYLICGGNCYWVELERLIMRKN